MKSLILKSVEDSIKAVTQLKQPQALSFLENASEMLASAFDNGSKMIIAGNGGSLCDASHLAEELTGLFRNTGKLCLPSSYQILDISLVQAMI